MTKAIAGEELGKKLSQSIPDAIEEATGSCIVVKPQAVLQVATHLKQSPDLDFDYLNCLTAVDYMEYMEVVYIMTSMQHNHSLVMKTRCNRERPEVPSVTGVWKGADLQEREVYDLLGISFTGHPNLKRLFMWEGFEGHPLRRDYL